MIQTLKWKFEKFILTCDHNSSTVPQNKNALLVHKNRIMEGGHCNIPIGYYLKQKELNKIEIITSFIINPFPQRRGKF